MKPGLLFIFPFWLAAHSLSGQFSTDFSEGNLDAWQGDKANFAINPSLQLQLNAPSGSTSSWLYAPVTYTDSMSWELYLKLDFAPSTSNQLKIFLGATSADLATTSGYFLEIGASGDQDPLEFKYRDNGSDLSLAASTPGLVAAEPVELTLRITRNGNGEWLFYSLAEAIPQLLFSANHAVLPLSGLSFFGLSCKYTDTRRDKFYFDDISVQPLQPDVTAPTCVSIEVIDAMTVELAFDEPLDVAIAQVPGNYILTPGATSPASIEIHQPNVVLHWNEPFTSQVEYTLSIQQLKDVAGNTMLPDQKTFTYIEIRDALPYEILITEIMADPTPAIGLPESEYIEIVHAGTGVFNLSDYSLVVGTSVRDLPDMMFSDQAYIILCDEEDAAAFSAYGKVAPVSGFPSLTNSGATVVLRNRQDEIIHEVRYSDSWYRDTEKADGGWSLEMTNPQYICSDMENWAAADNLLGGTPGKVNSRWAVTPDTEGPEFVSLFISTPNKIVLRFTERLDPLLAENPSAYAIIPATVITSAILQDPETVELTLGQALEQEVIYRLLPFEIADCLGNISMVPDTLVFGLTAPAEAGDLLINEILFNPQSGGSRFIEILNASQKFIDLLTISIGSLLGGQNDIYPTGTSEIISPGQIVVFSPDPADILSQYTVPQPLKLFEAPLPTWDDDTDNASLLAAGNVIDSFTYSSSWHLPIIADQNGVSLERVSAASATSSASNWHSAASTAGYATPTGINSQDLGPGGTGEMPFSITNKQFSPDDDGHKDFLALNFLLTSGEEIGSVWIYDLEGREIRNLISNESLGTSAIVQWDGRNGDEVVADMGIYIIFVQLWDAGGNVSEYQETCALVKR